MSKFCESTYEEAFTGLLEQNGREYTCGDDLRRKPRNGSTILNRTRHRVCAKFGMEISVKVCYYIGAFMMCKPEMRKERTI